MQDQVDWGARRRALVRGAYCWKDGLVMRLRNRSLCCCCDCWRLVQEEEANEEEANEDNDQRAELEQL
jgi:hypothetical protein